MGNSRWTGSTVAPDGGVPTGRHRPWRGHPPRAVFAAIAVLTLLAGLFLVPSITSRTARPADSGPSIGAVQALYSQDLLARINAERAARNSGAQPVPPLAVDPGLAAAAQSWSAHLASTGVVQDPALSACGPAPTAGVVCELAGNTGSSGHGLWPGDGSDGMEAAYMSSSVHRQNMLNAGYDEVGIGVTCSGGQAWTVEFFGFAYGTIGSAQSRQAAQAAVAGIPVPAAPMVAGTQTGDPVYCPGQTVGPNGRTTATGGQYAYPDAVPAVPGEPVTVPTAVGIAAADGDRGYWVARSDGSVKALGAATDLGSMAGQTLAFPVVQIAATPDGQGYWLVGSDGGVFSFGDAAFYGSTGALHLNAPIVGMASTADGHGYWLGASDGGVFSFGDAPFQGSAGSLVLQAPITGLAADQSTGGYWLTGADGGVFAYAAPFAGAG